MQKTPLSQIFREELTRALVFGIGFLVIISAGFVSVTYAAANGGKFGEILNKILVSSWDDPTNTGTVRNAMSLSGMTSSQFVPVKANQSCGVGKCIMGFSPDGTVNCTP